MNLQTSAPKLTGSRERTLDEVKAELMRRAGRLNPFEEIRREDAERVMDALNEPRQGSLGRGVEQARSLLREEG